VNLDELRVSKSVRSADWIATEYNNQSSPSTFYSVGAAVTGGGGGGNPTPAITSLSPPSAVAGASAQTLTLNGTGFVASSTVTYNGVGHAATFVSSTQLTITLTTTDQATAGSYPVVVTNPVPGGGTSSPLNFAVNNPAPNVVSLSPPSVVAGASAQTLTLTGTGFVASSTVTYNGVGHAATFVSSTQLTITLTTADQATAGSYPVVVMNPAPGGGISSPLNFTVLPLSAPTGLTATAGNAQVSLTWNASSGATSYNVYSATTNGGPYTEITNVTTLSYTNTGLSNGTTYYYVVTAVNSSGQSGDSNQASAAPSSSSWSNGYTNMRTITINSTQVPNTNQTNFPVLISLPANTYADLKTVANGGSVTNANGYDILFTSDAAGTQPLAYERESYSGTTGAMIDWVNVPTVSHTANTVIYLFYGNSLVTTDQSNATGTWDSNYIGVWHLPNGTTLSAHDSTSNGDNGTINGATATTGQIDGGASFNGSGNDITFSGGAIGATSVTVSAWMYTKGFTQATFGSGSDGAVVFGTRDADANVSPTLVISPVGGSQHAIFTCDSSGLAVGAEGATTISTGQWYYFVGTFSSTGSGTYGGTWNVYVNGVQDNSSTNNFDLAGSCSGTFSGATWFAATNGQWNGTSDVNLDELRVSKSVRSADWIATEYNNQSSPSTFYSVGAAVTGGGASSPAITGTSPSSRATGGAGTIRGSNLGSSHEVPW
jgi:hypothetical protein